MDHSLLWLWTRLLCPWYSPGKNTGGDCHALLHRLPQPIPNMFMASSFTVFRPFLRGHCITWLLITLYEINLTHPLTITPSCLPGRPNIFFFFFLFNLFYFILFVVNFVIHWNETAMGLHVFPILIPPLTSLSTRSL